MDLVVEYNFQKNLTLLLRLQFQFWNYDLCIELDKRHKKEVLVAVLQKNVLLGDQIKMKKRSRCVNKKRGIQLLCLDWANKWIGTWC